MAAAVIDTGVNYNHEALGGGLGPGKKVEAGWNFAAGNGDPNASASQHGTAVAGLIASEDLAHPGVAPGVDIVALRVFDDSNNGDFNHIADALQWVIDHHAQYSITVVNVSISDGNNYTMDWFSEDGGIGQRIEGLVQQLDALRIPVVTATGNSFTGQQGEGFIAILPGTIRVTATNATDHFASDAQRLGPIGGVSATDLAAPGVGLVAPVQGNEFAPVDGTSFAAAETTGAIVLLQQLYESRFGQLPSVNDLDTWLKAGAKPINDAATGITIGRLDLLQSAQLVPGGPSHPPAGSPAENPTGAPATPPAPSTAHSPAIPNSGTPRSFGPKPGTGIGPSTGTAGFTSPTRLSNDTVVPETVFQPRANLAPAALTTVGLKSATRSAGLSSDSAPGQAELIVNGRDARPEHLDQAVNPLHEIDSLFLANIRLHRLPAGTISHHATVKAVARFPYGALFLRELAGSGLKATPSAAHSGSAPYARKGVVPVHRSVHPSTPAGPRWSRPGPKSLANRQSSR
jgi:type VI secretion system secreted protein VgrG